MLLYFFLIHCSVYSHRCHLPKWTGLWFLLKIIFLMPGTGLYLSETQNARSVQLLSHVQLFVTPWTAAHQASLSITNSRSLLKLMSIALTKQTFVGKLMCSAFFKVQVSHPYMTTGQTKALTRWTFVGKVMPLLFNMLSRLVITFLSKSKHLLISWLQSLSSVILDPTKIKSVTVSIVSPLAICQ